MNGQTLDVTGLKCPMPMLKAKKALAALNAGDVLTVLATDRTAPDDFAAFCRQTGHELVSCSENGGVMTIVVRHK